MRRNFYYIGHRGCRDSTIPENTIMAFEKAYKHGANYVEFDVQKTKNDILVVLHDTSLDRTTTGSGMIRDFTSAEILNFKTKVKGQKIPLVREVLIAFKGKIKFMVELKAKNVGEDVLNLVKKLGVLKSCIFSGRNLAELKYLKKHNQGSRICYNITKGIDLKLDDFMRQGEQKKMAFLDMISLRSSLITKKFIQICAKNEILAFSWDFMNYNNPIEKIKSLVKMGVDGILFDSCKNIQIIKKGL